MANTTIMVGRRDAVILADRFILELSRHWLLVANLVLGLWVLLPWLAPMLMAAGLTGGARIIYTLYALQCHQLPQRSYFLGGSHLMYPLADIQVAWPYTDHSDLRRFIGNPTMGYKVAWSDRMVSLYTPLFVGGLLFAMARWRHCGSRTAQAAPAKHGRRSSSTPWRPLPVRWWLVTLVPLAVDGLTHLASDVGLGFREGNAWLAALTGNALAPTFYTGDAIDSFNWWLRLLTGLLAGSATVWLVYPHLDVAFADLRRSLETKLHPRER